MITSERREAMRTLLARAEIGADLMERGGLLSFAKMSRIIASEAKDALDALDEMERERDQLAHLRMDHCIALQLLSSSETRGPILVTGCADASRNGAYEFRDGRVVRLDKCEA